MLFARQDLLHTMVVATIAGLAFGLVQLVSELTTDLVALLGLTFVAAVAAVLWLRLYWPRLSLDDKSTPPAS